MSSSVRTAQVEFTLDTGQCIGCAICADLCPSDALAMNLDVIVPTWVPGLCNGCTVCARQCPTGAIEVARTPR